jgi:hypothetical protein
LSPLGTDTAQAPYIIPQHVRGSRIEIARVYHSSRRSPDSNFPLLLPTDGAGGSDQSLFSAQPNPGGAILRHMKVEEIAEAIAKLPPDQLARFRRWFTAFEAGRTDHAEELDSTATKLGRFAGRTFAELKKRAKEP